ncbi:PhzF family phenazine biosynthesis protein [Balamuthia mandrillaris]
MEEEAELNAETFFLPDEIFLQVLEGIPAKDLLASVFLVCKRWKRKASDDSLWKSKCALRWGSDSSHEAQHCGVTDWLAYFSEKVRFEALPLLPVTYRSSMKGPYQPYYSNTASTEDLLSIRNFFEVGAFCFQEGQLAEAIRALEVEVVRHPMNHRAWALLAKAYMENDCDTPSIYCACTALRIEPSNRDVLLDLAVSFINEVESGHASYFLSQWLLYSSYKAKLEDFTQSNVSMFSENEFASAGNSLSALKKVFSEIIEEHPDDVEVRITLGVLETASFDFTKAIQHYEQALKVDPTNYALWNKLGATRANSALALHACHAYQEALRLRPGYVRCLANVGIAHQLMNSPRTAVAWWTTALLRNPNARHIWDYLRMQFLEDNTETAQLKEAVTRQDVSWLKKHFIDEETEPLSVIPPNHNEQEERPPISTTGSTVDSFYQDWLRNMNQESGKEDPQVKEEEEEKEEPPEEMKEEEAKPQGRLSFAEVMRMIQEGKTPSDVQQIDDKPPNPNAPIVKGQRAAPLKPWQRAKKEDETASKDKVEKQAVATQQFTNNTNSTLRSSSTLASNSGTSGNSTSTVAFNNLNQQQTDSTITSKGMPIFTVDAFTSKPFAGNPAAVCLLPFPSALSEALMSKIAAEMNLSETAFVCPLPLDPLSSTPSATSYKTAKRFGLRWFTPTNEVALCGHATLATAHVLFHEVKVPLNSITFSTLSGDLIVERKRVDERQKEQGDLEEGTMMSMNFPQGFPELVEMPVESVVLPLLGAMGLHLSDLLPVPASSSSSLSSSASSQLFSFCQKTKKLVLHLKSVQRLLEVNPDQKALLALRFPSNVPVRGVMITTLGGNSTLSSSFPCYEGEEALRLREESIAVFPTWDRYDFISRYFSPWNGIEEDPVTGSAHTVLAVYWSELLGKDELRAFQASKRGGELFIRLDRCSGRVSLEGTAITVFGGRLRV